MATTKDDLLRVVNEFIATVDAQTAAHEEQNAKHTALVTAMQEDKVAGEGYLAAAAAVKAKQDELVATAQNLGDDNPET